MKMNRKMAITTAIVMGLSMQFMQPANLMKDGVAASFGMPRAEAGIMGALKGSVDQLKRKAVSGAKSEAKKQVKKALHFDVNGVSSHKQDLIRNLSYAAQLEGYSTIRLGQALKMNPAKFSAENDALYSLQHGSALRVDVIRKATPAISEASVAEWGKAAELVLSDQSVLEQAAFKQNVKESAHARSGAALYNALAARDALFIIKETTKALASKNDLGNQLNTVQEFMDYAKKAQQLINEQKAHSKALHQVHQKVEKATNTKALNKSEAKSFASGLVKG